MTDAQTDSSPYLEAETAVAHIPDDFQFTFGWWHNAEISRKQVIGGQKIDKTAYHKHLSHGGSYDQFQYGTEKPMPQGFGGKCAHEGHDEHGHQRAVICARQTHLFVVDVDDPINYALTQTAELLGKDQAMTTRGVGFHVYVYVPPELMGQWPTQGPIAGGDIKANGFVPAPLTVHYTGHKYELRPGAAVVVATSQLLAAVNADRQARRLANGPGGERGDGNDPELFSYCGALYAANPADKEGAWEMWLRKAMSLPLSDPTWPWSEADRDRFEHHWSYCEQAHAVNHPPVSSPFLPPVVTVTAPVPHLPVPSVAVKPGGGGTAVPAPPQPPVVSAAPVAPSLAPSLPEVVTVADITEAAPVTEGGTQAARKGDDAASVAEPDWTALDAAGTPEDPLTAVRRFEPCWRDDEENLTLRAWRGAWVGWTGTHWAEVEEAALRAWIYPRVEHARWSKKTAKGEIKMPWAPTRAKVTNVLDAMAATWHLDSAVEQPAWLDGRQEMELISLRNALVNPVTRQEHPHTAAYFTGYSLPFDHDPGAGCPRWDAFLASVFPGDAESAALLQEWFGYVISGRTDLQKMLFLVGASRSGKGTVARTLTSLIGKANVAAPTMHNLSTNFGLSSLIGKSLAVIGDARTSAKTDTQLIIERLLMITGEDSIDVDRKNRAIWTGKLPTRVTMLSNDLPSFRDSSGAIVNRMLVLKFTQSFLGREDLDLEPELQGELSGIFNWALVGLERINRVRRFTTPAASQEIIKEMEEYASPISVFLAEKCEVGDGYWVSRDDLFTAWLLWNGDAVKDGQAARTWFGRSLHAAVPSLGDTTGRTRGYNGVRLRPGNATFIAGLRGTGEVVRELPKREGI